MQRVVLFAVVVLFISPLFSVELQVQKSQRKHDYAEILNKTQSGQNENSKYKSSITEVPIGTTSLFTRVYYFNTMEEGAEIAKEIYGIDGFNQFEKAPFKKLRYMTVGDPLSKYEYGMFKSNNEFWILKNNADGWLWGKGFFVTNSGNF